MSAGLPLVKGTTVRLLSSGELGSVDDDDGQGVEVTTQRGQRVRLKRGELLTYREFNDQQAVRLKVSP